MMSNEGRTQFEGIDTVRYDVEKETQIGQEGGDLNEGI